MKTASKVSLTRLGFSLVELLAVILIVSIVLGFAIPNFLNLAPSRKASIGEIAALLEKARARAVASQRDVYVCFVSEEIADSGFPFRAMGVFTSTSFAEEGEPVDVRELTQIEKVFFLPDGLVFADQADLVNQGREGDELTVFESPMTRDFPFRVRGGIDVGSFPYLLFNKSGRLEVPFFSESEVFIAISEGFFESGEKVLIGDEERDLSELIRINYQSGSMTTLAR